MQYEINKTIRGGKTANVQPHSAFFVFGQNCLFLGKPGSLELTFSFYLNLLWLQTPS